MVVLVWRACWLAGWYYSHLALPPFPWSVCRVHLMLSLPGWACRYYSPNLDITPFLWSACRVHLMSSLPGWACHYYSRNLPIPTFPWSACRVHLMSSLLGWACQYYSPNFRHYGKCNIGKMISIKISFTHDVESVWKVLYDVFSAAIYICFVIHTNRFWIKEKSTQL